uniref:Uncharacterized protein n=1 Tax=Solanum lycopersicum TaxID=4081 RepID=K4DEL4_SOLLC
MKNYLHSNFRRRKKSEVSIYVFQNFLISMKIIYDNNE